SIDRYSWISHALAHDCSHFFARPGVQECQFLVIPLRPETFYASPTPPPLQKGARLYVVSCRYCQEMSSRNRKKICRAPIKRPRILYNNKVLSGKAIGERDGMKILSGFRQSFTVGQKRRGETFCLERPRVLIR